VSAPTLAARLSDAVAALTHAAMELARAEIDRDLDELSDEGLALFAGAFATADEAWGRVLREAASALARAPEREALADAYIAWQRSIGHNTTRKVAQKFADFVLARLAAPQGTEEDEVRSEMRDLSYSAAMSFAKTEARCDVVADTAPSAPSEALLACPFCGAAAEVVIDDHSDYRAYWSKVARCSNRDCLVGPEAYSLHEGYGDAAEREVVTAWNRRVAPVADEPSEDYVGGNCSVCGKHDGPHSPEPGGPRP